MMTRPLMAMFVVCGLAAPATLAAQGTGVRDDVKLGKAYVSGENPVIRLLDKPDGTALAVASFWRVVWSPAGQGHVMYVTTGDGKGPGDLRIALTDNQKLLDYLTKEMLGTFDKTYFDRPFTMVKATCSGSGDAIKERKETCQGDRYTVELTWRDFYEPFQLDTPVGGQRNPFGVTSFFIPARTAEVTVNGKKSAGNVYPQKRGPAQSSTAFLAFSESWIK